MTVIRRLLKPIASLRLTVVLLAMSMFLVFASTLAQVHEGVWTIVDRYFRSYFVRIDFQIFVPESVAQVRGAIPFPAGITIGVALLVNLLAAHTVRFKLKWRRGGIMLIHLGVILLLVGEFVTAAFAKEGNMTIVEGETANYTEDIRTVELAVIDGSGASDDLVVVVPERVLKTRGKQITHGLLPFDIRVDEWMPNSRLLGPAQTPASRRGLADSGDARSLAAVRLTRATGVDGQSVDVPSAYVTLFDDGTRIGTFLVSVHRDAPQQVVIGDRTYGLQLRFERNYKSYSLHLIDFSHDKFVGTETPRNYSSLVRLVDAGRNVDREVLIYMNHPLRFGGETFYQASFLRDDSGTVLQVVRNPGWLIPYVSCTMVAVGMLLQFGIRLLPRTRSPAQ